MPQQLHRYQGVIFFNLTMKTVRQAIPTLCRYVTGRVKAEKSTCFRCECNPSHVAVLLTIHLTVMLK